MNNKLRHAGVVGSWETCPSMTGWVGGSKLASLGMS